MKILTLLLFGLACGDYEVPNDLLDTCLGNSQEFDNTHGNIKL